MAGLSMHNIWMATEYAVKSEANIMKEKLHFFREQYRKANTADIINCNKAFIEWNEELLSFCKANKRKYHTESRTKTLDRQRLKYQVTIAKKEEENKKLREDLKEVREGKDEALNRLSELQSQLLKFGNLEITDLGGKNRQPNFEERPKELIDQDGKNRPTNLAERYKELYDNEWTDTFEFLTEQNGKDDQEAIDILYAMLKSCCEFCSKSVHKQYKTLAGLVSDPLRVKTGDVVLHGKVKVAAKEFIKSIAVESLKNVTVADVLPVMKKEQQFTEDILQNGDVKIYLEKIFKLCWLMQTQYPPMWINFTNTPGSAFDKDLFDSFTCRGPKIEQIIWPPVFLHEGGSLLTKGVAEGTKKYKKTYLSR